MIIKRLLFVAAFMFVVTLNFSCAEPESVEQIEADYQSVKKSEIDDEHDT